MVPSYATATDEIYGRIHQVVNSADVTTLLEYAPVGRYPGYEQDAPDNTHIWFRASRQTVDIPQTGFGNSPVMPSKRKFTNYGIIFVQIFMPKSPVDLYNKGMTVAEFIVKNAFRNKVTEHGIVFTNAKVIELNPEKDWNRVNVSSQYEYCEIN